MLYLCVYGAAYTMKSPAANMGYFVYAGTGMEKPLYYFLYPAYRLHRALGGVRHNLDREPVEDTREQ
jgi:hypothetical protein